VTVFDLSDTAADGAHGIAVDLTDEAAMTAAFDEAERLAGTVTGLVASAGVRGAYLPAVALDAAHLRRTWEVNVLGTFLPAREMVRRLGGAPASVVAVSSTTAYRGWPQQVDYATSKAAVRQLVENLAIEWAPFGVRVNAVAPGHTRTPMVEDMVEGGYDLAPVKARTPLGRLAEPAEQAREIVHLLLDATFVTGQCLAVDGGWTAVGK